jgi:hypothetical protein
MYSKYSNLLCRGLLSIASSATSLILIFYLVKAHAGPNSSHFLAVYSGMQPIGSMLLSQLVYGRAHFFANTNSGRILVLKLWPITAILLIFLFLVPTLVAPGLVGSLSTALLVFFALRDTIRLSVAHWQPTARLCLILGSSFIVTSALFLGISYALSGVSRGFIGFAADANQTLLIASLSLNVLFVATSIFLSSATRIVARYESIPLRGIELVSADTGSILLAFATLSLPVFLLSSDQFNAYRALLGVFAFTGSVTSLMQSARLSSQRALAVHRFAAGISAVGLLSVCAYASLRICRLGSILSLNGVFISVATLVFAASACIMGISFYTIRPRARSLCNVSLAILFSFLSLAYLACCRLLGVSTTSLDVIMILAFSHSCFIVLSLRMDSSSELTAFFSPDKACPN